MNFLAMVNELCDELDEAQVTTLQGTPTTQIRRMKSHINRAYNYIWMELNPTNEAAETEATITTVAQTEYISIPATINYVDMIFFNTDPPIRIIPWTEYKHHKSDVLVVTDTGYPVTASIYQRKIYFYPVPDQAYTGTVRGRSVLTELSADADVPALVTDLHRVIVEWALYFQMKYENNPRVNSQLALAQQCLQLARNNNRGHSQDLPTVINERDLSRLDYQRRIIRY